MFKRDSLLPCFAPGEPPSRQRPPADVPHFWEASGVVRSGRGRPTTNKTPPPPAQRRHSFHPSSPMHARGSQLHAPAHGAPLTVTRIARPFYLADPASAANAAASTTRMRGLPAARARSLAVL